MMNINKIVESVVLPANGKKDFVKEAVNRILGEDISAGQDAVVLADPVSGHEGIKVKVKSINTNNPGFAECETESGAKMYFQTSLLAPV